MRRAALFTFVGIAFAIIATLGGRMSAQTDPRTTYTLPDPFLSIDRQETLSGERTWGTASALVMDRSGHSWVLQRCWANTCVGSTADPILEFDLSGKFLKSLGGGMFVTPHGLYADNDGNIWATDFQANAGKGLQVLKFSPEGKVLMALGKAGVSGNGPGEFSMPSSVAVAANGDIFVGDGHGGNSNERVVKFSKDGKFIKAWGKPGSGPGEFAVLHAMAFDAEGRLFIADRNNNRIQIFDQDGHFLAEWKQFSRPSTIWIDKNDTIYVTDADSNAKNHPGWPRGMRIGSAKSGIVNTFIPDPNPDPNFAGSSEAELRGIWFPHVKHSATIPLLIH